MADINGGQLVCSAKKGLGPRTNGMSALRTLTEWLGSQLWNILSSKPGANDIGRDQRQGESTGTREKEP